MSNLAELLQTTSITTALIVDDAVDKVPLATDLTIETDEWTNFFSDVQGPDREAVLKFYPNYETTNSDDLKTSNEFVALLWENQDKLSSEVVGPLFARYKADKATDLEYIQSLEEKLQEFGLACTRSGRNYTAAAQSADLIVIDLFLGAAQEGQDIERSIDLLRRVVQGRAERPPLVILMSRSHRLEEKRSEYRDKAGLFESAFRIINKGSLKDPNKLARIVTRLANHYDDSLKLVRFSRAWKAGLEDAGERTVKAMRSLDLPEIEQVKQLLLTAEQAPTGAYLVDVFDRVHSHELEGQQGIIDAAIDLNSLTAEKYPPPYVAGSRALQKFAYSALFQHPQRLRLAGSSSKVSFGDVLRLVRTATVAPNLPAEEVNAATDDFAGAVSAVFGGIAAVGAAMNPAQEAARIWKSPLHDIRDNQVVAVLTPACDLQRKEAQRVLLMVGVIKPLDAQTWKYDSNAATAAYIGSDGKEYLIKWDLKHIETVSHDDLEFLLSDEGEFKVIARLREAHAIELQQRLLASLGRVGLPAPMPATFDFELIVAVPNAEKKCMKLTIPVLENSPPVCYVGRGDIKRLILCEAAGEAICEALQELDLDTVYPDAREAIRYAIDSNQLVSLLEKGLDIKLNQTDWKDVPCPSGTMDGQKVRAICLLGTTSLLDSILTNGNAKRGVLLAFRAKTLA